MKRKSFTLIELLVVVAIIAVLVSVLLPAIASARVQGRKLKCSSQFRQIFLVAYYYAEDNNGWINGPYRSTYKHWYTDFQNYAPKAGIGFWWQVNNCPEENPDIAICYAMNRSFPPNGWNAPFKFQLNRETLSTTLFFCDFAIAQLLVAPRNWGPSGFTQIDIYDRRLRHGGRVNVLLYDGHVNSFSDLDETGINW